MTYLHRLPRLIIVVLIVGQAFAAMATPFGSDRATLAQIEPTATEVAIEEPSPVTATPTPTITVVEPTPTDEVTVEPTSTATPSPTETPATPATETPTSTVVASETPDPSTATPEITPTPTPTPTATSVVRPAVIPTPRLAISKNAGNVGNALGVSISGFPALKRVAIYFDGSRKVTLVTNGAGAANGSIRVPAAAAGLHEIKASGSGKSAVKNFRIRPVFTLDPNSVVAGGMVTASMTGFAANSQVRIRLYEINGSNIVLSVWVATTDAKGSRTQNYATKTTLTTGKHQVIATDSARNAKTTALSILARPAPPPPDDWGISTVYSRGTSGRPEIALTFDADSDRGYAGTILDILADYGVKASFGITGYWAAANPDLIRRMVNEGHQIINHSYWHPSFTGAVPSEPMVVLSRDARLNELNSLAELIAQITGGYDVKPYFRPPYGDYDASVLRDIAAGGYTATIMWSCDTNGYAGASVDAILANCAYPARSGDIVLMHSGSSSRDALALRQMIEILLGRGYRLVTVERLLQP